MARIRSRDTKPELQVRRFLHAEGLRFRLHRKDLPGKPDLVFPRRRLCVFVDGCFWHGCPSCVDGTRAVKSNSAYWVGKIHGNQERDRRHDKELAAQGWQVLRIWECEVRDAGKLRQLAELIRIADGRSQAEKEGIGRSGQPVR